MILKPTRLNFLNKDDDNNFHHYEDANHDFQHDRVINKGNEYFLNISTNYTTHMQFQVGRNHVSTLKAQPYEKYDEDHAFLADNVNPEKTFEVTEIQFNKLILFLQALKERELQTFIVIYLAPQHFIMSLSRSNITTMFHFDVNHDRVLYFSFI